MKTKFTLFAILLALTKVTISQVQIVEDYYPGQTELGPSEFVTFQDKLFFHNDYGDMMFSYDGYQITPESAAGQFESLDITPYSSVIYMGDLYFYAEGLNSQGSQLWKYDGNQFTEIIVNPNGNASPYDFYVYNGVLYFKALSDGFGVELFSYDGSNVTLHDINPGSGNSNPQHFIEYDDTMYFSASVAGFGNELIKFDGTNHEVIDFNPGTGHAYPSAEIVFNDTLFVRANSGLTGPELFKYDGQNFILVDDINSGTAASYPEQFIEYNQRLLFIADNGINGKELHEYHNGVVSMLIDLNNQSSGSYINSYLIKDNMLYFLGYDDDPSNGPNFNLIKYDGNQFTAILENNGQNVNVKGYNDLYVFNDSIFFQASYSSNSIGWELFKSDGQMMYLVEDIRQGPENSNPKHFIEYKENLYFTARYAYSGQELFRYCGPVVSTVTAGSSGLIADQGYSTYQWIDCSTDLPVPGATNQTFVPSTNGDYKVEITSYCRVDTSSCATFQSASIKENQNEAFKIYPNPSSSNQNLNLLLPKDFSGKLLIQDLSGKIIDESILLHGGVIEYRKLLSKGLYMVSFLNDNNELLQTRKLIIN